MLQQDTQTHTQTDRQTGCACVAVRVFALSIFLSSPSPNVLPQPDKNGLLSTTVLFLSILVLVIDEMLVLWDCTYDFPLSRRFLVILIAHLVSFVHLAKTNSLSYHWYQFLSATFLNSLYFHILSALKNWKKMFQRVCKWQIDSQFFLNLMKSPNSVAP